MMTKTTSPSKEEEVKKINSIRVIVGWNSFSPDCRQWKPSTPVFIFDKPLPIAVDVPLTKDLIDNADIISLAQISNQSVPSPIFTPLGMRYIIDQFEAVMQNGKPEEETAKSDDEDWGEEKEPEKTVLNITVDSEWEDEDITKTSKDAEDDAPWKEDWEE